MAAVVRYIKDSPEFSDEDREWARQAREQSEYKFAVDLQSKMVDARRDGERSGSDKRAITIARNLLGINMPLNQIAAATGLTYDEVEGLCKVD